MADQRIRIPIAGRHEWEAAAFHSAICTLLPMLFPSSVGGVLLPVSAALLALFGMATCVERS